MKTAVSLPDPLFDAAEQVAKRLGVSRSELYQRALRAFVAKYQSDSITKALDAVYEADSDAGRLDPALTSMQAASLETDEW